MSLTVTGIRKLKATNKDQWYGDGSGLYLRIYPTGSMVWVNRQRQYGKTRIKKLGEFPTLSLKQARAKNATHHLKQDVSAITVADLAEKYMLEVIKPTHKRPELVQGYMERAILPTMRRRKVQDVTRAQCVEMIQRYAVEHGYNGKPAARSADQLRSNLKKMFSYALELGLLESNPLAEVTRRVSGYRPVARKRVLTDDEIRLIWQEENHNAKLLRFLLLTGLRISEGQKGQIDEQESRWVVDAEISKTTAHWVHLTPEALKQLPLHSSSPTSVQAWLRRWCDRKGISPRFTPHDLRRTFVTRLNELGVMPHIVEKCVNHKLEGVLAVYNHAEHEQERTTAAELMERHILHVVG